MTDRHPQDRKAWEGLLDELVAERATRRPRQSGLTMMLDRCLGMRATEDLLELAGDYLDFVKLSFGTPLLLDESFLRRKIDRHRDRGVDVLPGGTLTELAIGRGIYPRFVTWAVKMGFTAVEISDGILSIPRGVRDDAIARAREAGLLVLTEVGKKSPDLPVPTGELCELIGTDLENGARWVVVEARESGRGVGVFDPRGRLREDQLAELVAGLGERHHRLIWEAPRQSQQVALIRRLGSQVNLGNVKPRDLLGLEALRCGLRFETFEAGAARDELKASR